MALININMDGTLGRPEIIAGIDLGTTNSLIAYINKHNNFQPECVKDNNGTTLVPSIVHFGNNGKITVGNDAKSYLINDPQRTVFSVKRLMGKSYKDVKGYENFFSYKIIDDDTDKIVQVRVGDKFYTPVELSSLILKELKARAEETLQVVIHKVVITVPAYFNDAQRQATRDAGKLAGMEVLRIINEPTAASLAYGIGIEPTEEKTVAVYDLGGGTFDVSILKLHNGIFEVLSTHGDTFLGGDDIDRAIVQHWSSIHNLPHDTPDMQALRLEAEKAKIHLTNNDEFDGIFNGQHLKLTRKELEHLAHPFLERTINSCKQALKDAHLTIDKIDQVLMVGGSTRMPYIKDSVSNFFKRVVNDSLNPDEVVALGAAVQADVLAGRNKEILLLDITPLSLGIETMGGLMDVIIPRNNKIPTRAGRQYTTQKDGQTHMRITVYQGERDRVSDNRKLAEFELNNIPAMPAGLPKVEVGFILNADGILQVRAKELRSGVEQTIDVKPQYGLTDAEVEKMLMDSITHAQEDVNHRTLMEARNEAIQVVAATHKFLKQHAAILGDDVVGTFNTMSAHLEDVCKGTDKDGIHKAMDELNTYARPYAEKVMDTVISGAMKGKGI